MACDPSPAVQVPELNPFITKFMRLFAMFANLARTLQKGFLSNADVRKHFDGKTGDVAFANS
jgi:hypothetical protein